MDPDKPRWRAKQLAQAAGTGRPTLQKWRERYGLPSGAVVSQSASLFSFVDICVVVLMATMTRRKFNAADSAEWAEKLRPTFQKAARQLLNFGRRPDAQFKVEQKPVNGLDAVAVTFDLAAIVEWVAQSLDVAIPSPRPTTQEARAFLAHVQSAKFRERLDVLKQEIEARSPRHWTWADVERVCGVPEWFAQWALEQPRSTARTEIENVRDAMPEMRLQ